MPMVDRVCLCCGKQFVLKCSDVARGRGRFCSLACAKYDPRGPAERLWANVAAVGDCVLWQGSVSPAGGYGQLNVRGRDGTQRLYRTHRLAYELYNGPIPEGMFVCHRCDNPRCVRHDHLFLGTQADNMADCKTKNRQARGDSSGARLHPERIPKGAGHYKAKLTEQQVAAIRQEYDTQRTSQRQLAARYGVSQQTICRAINRQSYR
jgi:hypothetical protein